MSERTRRARAEGRRPRARRSIAVAAVLLAIGLAAADLVAPGPARAQAAPCAGDPAYRLLDFWIGDWNVLSGGARVGTNRIVPILNGCAIREQWSSARGGAGESLFFHVPATGEWKQVWVTDSATSRGGVKEKRLVERLEGGAVRFQGAIPLPGGDRYLDRTTLTPEKDGRVRQVIEVSADGGATWRTTFDAIYLRRGGDGSAADPPASDVRPAPAGGAGAAGDERELMEADRAFARAAAERGLEGWVSWFTDDAARVVAGGPIARGQAGIRELDGPLFSDPKARLTWEPVEAGLFAPGDHGFTRGRFRLVRGGAGEADTTGWYLSIWRWERDGWRVILDTGGPDEQGGS